ncbi:MAG: GAF domain-containing protein [Terriglobales bacterium]
MASARALPALDEATFQQMLEAAYVLQQRIQQQPALRRRHKLADTLAQIAATQEVLHSKEWDLKTSARLIAEQLQKITSAAGVAVALIEEDQLEYCAAVGDAASLAGLAMPIDSSLSEFLQTAAANPALIGELLKQHGSRSPFLFPVYHEGKVSGLLDVRFAESEDIGEPEVQSCQVMAGLMGQAIASAAKLEWKQALATERATMLDVLERLRPQLERLAAEPAAETPAEAEGQVEPTAEAQEKTAPEIEALLSAMSQAAEKNNTGAICGECGYQFGESELFCGRCGRPRLMSSQAKQLDFLNDATQSPQRTPAEEPATAKQEKEESDAGPELVSEAPVPAALEPTLTQFPSEATLIDGSSALALRGVAEETTTSEPEAQEPKPAIVAAPQHAELAAPPTWTSAAKTLHWLRSLEQANSPERMWLAKHRGDISIAVSAMVLLLALTGWGLHPGNGGTGTSKNPNQPRLTLFERMLVGLGVAEAPPQPVATGNPNVWVWVDVHTALYYCPGADLYGKTPGGKFVLQREAQIDHFQPAERASCE